MDSVPHTPDQQTRNAVTRRIIAHVTAGWPRLGEPLIRHRGQYCYVAALLPGHREPSPILRLRYQGSADRWAIAIYKASTGQYTETELPGSFGRNRHAGTRDRRHLHPLRRPQNRELTALDRDTQEKCESRVIIRGVKIQLPAMLSLSM